MSDTPDFQAAAAAAELGRSPTQVLEVIRGLTLECMEPARPWQGFIVATVVDGTNISSSLGVFDGIFMRTTRVDSHDSAKADQLKRTYRDLTPDPQRGYWRTWLLRYDEQRERWDDWFFWPGDDIDPTTWDLAAQQAAFDELNPVDPTLLEAPYSHIGAAQLAARLCRRDGLGALFTMRNYSWDRLPDGYRIYRRADGARTAAAGLQSLAETAHGSVFLVADNQAVELCDVPPEDHAARLAALNAEQRSVDPRSPMRRRLHDLFGDGPAPGAPGYRSSSPG